MLSAGRAGVLLRGRRQAELLRRRDPGRVRVPVTPPRPEPPDATEIWREFNGRLLAFVSRRVPDRDSAEDILQDVMLRIHRHAGDAEHAEAIGAWIHQIARNAIADHYRRAAVRREYPAGVELEWHEAAPSEPASLRGELAACLRPLVQRLAPTYRDAITLTELDGLTQAAAAERLELSTSGMKSRVQRGRAQLRDLLVSCCEIELDRRGAIASYQPRRTPCDCRVAAHP